MTLNNIELVVNGNANAYAPEFGCNCARCLHANPTSTSASLLADKDDGTLLHLLFDAGRSVASAISVEPRLQQAAKPALDWVVLSHWHGDHTADLAVILPGLARVRNRRQLDAPPPKLWCRQGTYNWLVRDHPYLPPLLDARIERAAEAPGKLLAPLDLGTDDVHVTPFTVSHSSADTALQGRTAFCCAGFCIETGRSKTVLLWDVDGNNDWIQLADGAAGLIRGADTLIVDCDSYADNRPGRTHASLDDVCRYVTALQPERTLLTHLSGHGDSGDGFGWADAQWAAAAERRWEERFLPGTVGVATPGLRLAL